MKKKTEAFTPEVKTYTTLKASASAEFEEKKSVFIGHAARVTTEDGAKEFIAAIKKEYSDATHNCWAYSIGEGNIARYSDDGEPQGTAGLPILNVIKGSGAVDAAVVVTRYFGGTLLGTGGLVRAYTEGAKIAIAASEVVTYECYDEVLAECSYSDYQKLQYEFPKYGVKTDEVDFGASVKMKLAVKRIVTAELSEKVSEIGAGKIIFNVIGERFDA